MNLGNLRFYAALVLCSIAICSAESDGKRSSVAEAGQTIQKLLNERIGKKIVEAAKEVKGILSQSLGSHVKQATTKLLVDNAVKNIQKQVPGTQTNNVATVGTDQSEAECIKNCKQKKQQKAIKPHIHRVQSMHKGAPSHKTPHNKGGRNRKNMPPIGQPGQSGQPPLGNTQQQQQPPSPEPAAASPTMPQTPSLTCPPPCPSTCAPACTQDCCRPMLSVVQVPPPPPPYYPPPPPPPPPPPMCAPPCTQPSCAPTCPVSCCVMSAPAPAPPPPPPPATCPGICVQHCYAICPRGCCRMDVPRKKHIISRKQKSHKAAHQPSEGSEEHEASSIISDRKSGSAESSPMERNKIPRKKGTTYNAAAV